MFTNQELVSSTTRGQVATVIDAVDPVGPKPGGEFLGVGSLVGVASISRARSGSTNPSITTASTPSAKGPGLVRDRRWAFSYKELFNRRNWRARQDSNL